MICKLTGIDGKPVKAHIIPQAFYLIEPEKGPLRLLTNKPDSYPKRSPIGVYDSTIVTAEGESYFLRWDAYASDLLLNHFHEAKPIKKDDGKIVGYEFTQYDYVQLKLFFLSLLWRAGASSHDVFKRVELGPHLDRIRTHLLKSDPGSPDDYATVLAVFDDVKGWAPIADPFPERYGENGIRFYRIYLGNFIAYVKVDRRPADDPMRQFQLTPEKPLLVTGRTFAESKDCRVMIDIARKTQGEGKI